MLLDDLGIHPNLLIAGFAGGLVHAFIRRTDPIGQIGSIIIGVVASNYLTPSVVSLSYVRNGLGGSQNAVNFCGFVIGSTAKAIMEGIAVLVQGKVDQMTKVKP